MKKFVWACVCLAACSEKLGSPGETFDGGAKPECDPGALQCSTAGSIERCSDEGLWTAFGTCQDPLVCEEGSCVEPEICIPEQRICEGLDVMACNVAGTAWSFVETCADLDTCNAGDCLNRCDLANGDDSFINCEFYEYTMDNPNLFSGNYSIVAANPNADVSQPAVITVEQRSGDDWISVGTMSVAPGGTNYLVLSQLNMHDSQLGVAKSRRVTSTLPILLYMLDGYTYGSGGGDASGATLLFPTAALGQQHYMVGLPQGTGNGYYNDARAHAVIIGTADATSVMVRASAHIMAGTGVPEVAIGDTTALTINAGDVLQLATTDPDDDFTGTYIESSEPVAVLTGHTRAEGNIYGQTDHYEEQLLPVEAWGKRFVAAKIIPTEDPSSAPMWRMVASEDATTVTFEAGTGTLDMPAGPVELQAGEWYETRANGNFFVEADKPILFAQWEMADPDMVLVPPVEQYLPEYYFTNFASGEVTATMTVVRAVGSTVTLDGIEWTAIWSDAGGGYEVAQTTSVVGNHIMSGSFSPDDNAPPMIFLRGNGGGCTFAYVAGMNLAPINGPICSRYQPPLD